MTPPRNAWVVGGYSHQVWRTVARTLAGFGVNLLKHTDTGSMDRKGGGHSGKMHPPDGADLCIILSTSISHNDSDLAKAAAKARGIPVMMCSHKGAEMTEALVRFGLTSPTKEEPVTEQPPTADQKMAALIEWVAHRPGATRRSFADWAGWPGAQNFASKHMHEVRRLAGLNARPGLGGVFGHAPTFHAWASQYGLQANVSSTKVTWVPTIAALRPKKPAPKKPAPKKPAPKKPAPKKPTESPTPLADFSAAIELLKEAMAKADVSMVSVSEDGTVKALKRIVTFEEIALP